MPIKPDNPAELEQSHRNTQSDTRLPSASPTQAVLSQAEVGADQDGKRLDQACAEMFPDYSRAQLQKWIKSGELTVDGEKSKPRSAVVAGQRVQIDALLQMSQTWGAESIALDIQFEDDHLLVVNKPPGLVVHPAAGNASGTLANAVLAHCPSNQHLPRAGIVHRLDKDTSGLLVIAKSSLAHNSLVDQLQRRSVNRLYRAIVCGNVIAGGRVEKPIGRDPLQRIKMAVRPSSDPNAKPAVTHYRITAKFRCHTELSVKLETGRTHQIRVHLSDAGFALLGDPIYGGKYQRPAGIDDEQSNRLAAFRRQALHAERLGFAHPDSQQLLEFSAEPPQDYQEILELVASL